MFNQHLQVREVDRATAQQLVAVRNKAPAALILPAGMSKRYLSEKPTSIELLTDPAQWEALQAIEVVLLLADREAATLGDPFSQELLHLKERSITSDRLSFSGLDQDLPGFSLMFVLLTMVLYRVDQSARGGSVGHQHNDCPSPRCPGGRCWEESCWRGSLSASHS